jgi:hypothetical protein
MTVQKQVQHRKSQKEIDEEFLRLVDRGIDEDKHLLKKLAKA